LRKRSGYNLSTINHFSPSQMKAKQLTEDFSLAEFTHSDTATRRGIDNTPSELQLFNIQTYLAPGMQRIRDALNRIRIDEAWKNNQSPLHREIYITISSGFRNATLNTILGGAPNSQHSMGLACDFSAPRFGTSREICEALIPLADEIGFDQLIDEDGKWVHVSFNQQPRREVLTGKFTDQGVTYTKGLT
jgi:zinc D-Ala-D-Ala carboxypeptidase